MRGGALPDNLVAKVFFPEHLIQQYLDVVPNVPVQVHINAGGVAHYGFDGDQVLVHPVEVVLFVPDVAVQGFFPTVGL